MNTASAPIDMLGRYALALRDFLLHDDALYDDETVLWCAYELGREAVAHDRGLLNFVDMHRQVIRDIDAQMPASSRREDRSLRFLSESLAAFALLHMSDQETSAALRQMNRLLENEAQRIAHALHDQAATMLAVIHLELADAEREASSPAQLQRVARITGQLDQLRAQLRRLSHELHPPMLSELGLVPAVRALSEGLARNADLRIALVAAADLQPPPTPASVAYRVVHEALGNIVRHARATQVDIRLWQRGDRLHGAVQDDGVGFDLAQRRRRPAAHGLGLIGMRERVRALRGSLHLWSEPGQGTIVRFSLPYRRQP